MTRRPNPHPRSAATLPGLVLALPMLLGTAAPASSGADGPPLDRRAATRAIDAIRHALPPGWDDHLLRWDTVPTGWRGPAHCLRIEVAPSWAADHDPSRYVVWLLPPCWEGRMEVTRLGRPPDAALYLGENASFRVLHEPRSSLWADGPQTVGDVLQLVTYPITPLPEHRLDVEAMQRLYRRLDGASGRPMERWLQQIYGIEELDRLLYLELLTWDERTGERDDPTWLGESAENETRFLAHAALAAFPDKTGLYLRRVTRETFSDVIVVNASRSGT